MPQYSDEEKEPFLNDDLELGCTSLKNRRQNIRGVNILIQIRSTISFTIYFVKTLLEKSTRFVFMAEDQPDSQPDPAPTSRNWSSKKFSELSWNDFEGQLCYAMLSPPEKFEWLFTWVTAIEPSYSLARWDVVLSGYPVARTVFASFKLGTAGICTLVDAIRYTGFCKSGLPTVPRHPYRRLSIMNVLASALCLEEIQHFRSIGNSDGVKATAIIAGGMLVINLFILSTRFETPSRASIEELKQFLTSPAANILPFGIYDHLSKEAHGTSDIENPANDAETGANSTD